MSEQLNVISTNGDQRDSLISYLWRVARFAFSATSCSSVTGTQRSPRRALMLLLALPIMMLTAPKAYTCRQRGHLSRSCLLS